MTKTLRQVAEDVAREVYRRNREWERAERGGTGGADSGSHQESAREERNT